MNDGKKDKKGTRSNPADDNQAPDPYEYVDIEIEALRNMLDSRKKKSGRSSSAKEKKQDENKTDTDSPKN